MTEMLELNARVLYLEKEVERLNNLIREQSVEAVSKIVYENLLKKMEENDD